MSDESRVMFHEIYGLFAINLFSLPIMILYFLFVHLAVVNLFILQLKLIIVSRHNASRVFNILIPIYLHSMQPTSLFSYC